MASPWQPSKLVILVAGAYILHGESPEWANGETTA